MADDENSQFCAILEVDIVALFGCKLIIYVAEREFIFFLLEDEQENHKIARFYHSLLSISSQIRR